MVQLVVAELRERKLERVTAGKKNSTLPDARLVRNLTLLNFCPSRPRAPNRRGCTFVPCAGLPCACLPCEAGASRLGSRNQSLES